MRAGNPNGGERERTGVCREPVELARAESFYLQQEDSRAPATARNPFEFVRDQVVIALL